MLTFQRLLFLFGWVFLAVSCQHVPLKPQREVLSGEKSLTSRNVGLIFVPENQKTQSYLLFDQKDRYHFGNASNTAGYKIETLVDPLMRNFFMQAVIEKNGKALRKYIAQKNATSVLSDKKTTWSPARPKMIVNIPYLNPGEEVVINTTYEWMDTRFLPPIFFQEDERGADSSIVLDVPYGITLHFKATIDRNSVSLVPKSLPKDHKQWANKDNQAGLGMRYLWQSTPQHQSTSPNKADFLQMFLAFDTPVRNDNLIKFDNWSEISKYLYNRIDRYDLASSDIQNFAHEHVKGLENVAKVKAIFSFLRNDVERRSALGSFNEQPAQPATRTFIRRFGSAFDIVILGKAMLESVGIDSAIVVASDKRFNPNISNFFTPALFSSVLLKATTAEGTFYFDPDEKNSVSELSPNLQGQNALVLKASKGEHFRLPYDSPNKHGHGLSYQLWIDQNGMLLGEYRIDLLGFENIEASTNVSVLEDKLKFLSLPFGIASAEILHHTKNETRLFGHIKPQLLAKNGNNFEFSLKNALLPFIKVSSSQRGYPLTAKLSLVIALPPGYSIKNLPNNVNLSFDGGTAWVSAINTNQELVVEGLSIISSPKASNELTTENLKSLTVFSEQNMIIGSDTAQGALDVQETTDAKNP